MKLNDNNNDTNGQQQEIFIKRNRTNNILKLNLMFSLH